jgi:hypothetical protein
MTSKYEAGSDPSKWRIHRLIPKHWVITPPPLQHIDLPMTLETYDTGAEALEAFARGHE